ncbi:MULTISPECIES: multidrug effflux MFS transporter [unclassified Undibacterium]|uniref:multidrug effflux MFS transporter n=1 Tax=unclassified Undibacterium TaxID=2630295 RepID=UPI002AC93C3C|nr:MULTISPECIES: multidrug effflux MFS transporter [unclassified Undibacterium]MEB0138393.1 multidrug effflux MFS transporter [Undibacterium sp. CCC2.1]MEB0171268.1 multidrug effflux MFS transporter [Undibacterium sp. CCC1.1]MEB0176610.1 multidrug effflux MFS transporter [Undibacterium sp. CCC3.4]MEB0214021.1 multidrug effflux MFS transporter [Undibacterium sp. 5I2]WPX43637.1 multidrug effflux MFS transporter [Undibacterium sp. CCC3.4]
MYSQTKLISERYPKWLLLIGIATALGPISMDMYLPVLPKIMTEFDAPQNQVQYTILVFLAGLAIGQLLYGPLSDRIGRKLPLCFGIVIYTIASVGCAFSENLAILMTWRFVQGMGGCAGVVIGRAIIRDRFGLTGSAQAFSFMLMVVLAGPMIAPVLGGWMADFGWRPIFGAMSALGAFLVGSIILSFKETLPKKKRVHSTASTAIRQYLLLLSCTQLLSYTIVVGLMQSALYAYVICAPFIIMEVYGVSPQYFGMVFFTNTAGLIVGSQINAVLVERFGPDRILGIALLSPIVLSLTLIASQLYGFSSLIVVLVALFGILSSHGFISPNGTALGLAHHAEQAGTASALMGAIQFGIGIVAISLTSFFKVTSILPLAFAIGFCSFLALACHRLAARPALKNSISQVEKNE